jgi:proliferating cell nuclear antigen
MKLTLSKPQILKDSIAIISELVTEAQFNVTTDGLTLIAMDPANVAMVIFKLLSSSFVEYNLVKEVDIALNLNNLKQVLRRVNSSDMLTLEIEDESKLKITIVGKTTRRFSLPIIELDDREQKIPNLQFPFTASMPADTFVEAVEDAGVVADSLSIIGEDKKITISAKGDLSSVEVDIKADDDVEIVKEGEDVIRSKYSIEYLKKIVSGARVSDTVKLQLSKDYPLRIEFVEKDKLQLSFVLAPRVEND